MTIPFAVELASAPASRVLVAVVVQLSVRTTPEIKRRTFIYGGDCHVF